MSVNGHLSESEDLASRVVQLEKKVKVQDDELVCLKSALSEAIRRLNQLETAKSGHGSSSRITQSARHNPPSSREPKSAKQASKPTPSVSKSDNHNKKITSADSQQSSRVKSKEAVPKDSGEGTVKIFIKGRPVTFYAPSSLSPDPLETPSNHPPKEKLALEWVYGYRGKDCRSNIYGLASGELVYFSAAVAIIHNTMQHSQRHYMGHNDDIKCMALHPDKVTVATGQVAGHDKNEGKPHVRIWSSVDLSTLKVIGLGVFERGVACVSFSKDGGSELAVVDDANEHVLSVWEWEKGHKVVDTKSSGDPVFFVEFNPTDSNLIVTCGKSHINFWTRDGNAIAKKAGIFEKLEKPKFVTCLTFSGEGDVISGDSNGNIHVWLKGSNKVHKAILAAHEGGVFCLYSLGDNDGGLGDDGDGDNGGFMSGGKDRKVVQWRMTDGDYVKAKEGHEFSEGNGSIRLILFIGEGQLVVGTTKNHILMGTYDGEMSYVVQGHVEETWGLGEHPEKGLFVTCGHDKLVQLWNAAEKKVLLAKEMPEACHALCIHPGGDMVVVSGNSPKWYVLNLLSLELIGSYCDASERVECVQFSPDGSLLACGSRDNYIYIYSLQEANKFSKVARLSGHSSFILHLDWAEDGQYLQSNSGDYELLFWNMSTFKQLLSPSSVRDVIWKSTTCALSFSSCGIWPEGADGTDINACTRSHDNRYLVSADDFGKVNLFNYPCYHPKSASMQHAGHSSHVTNVTFLPGDQTLISVGGKDASVMQWKFVA